MHGRGGMDQKLIIDLWTRMSELHDECEKRGISLVAATRLPGEDEAIVVHVGDRDSAEALIQRIRVVVTQADT